MLERSGSEPTRMDPLLQNDPGVTCWPSLFKTNVSSSRELENCQEPSADPGIHVEFEDEDTSVAKVTWGNALVGYFIGNNPPFFAIKSSLETSGCIVLLKPMSGYFQLVHLMLLWIFSVRFH